MSMRWMRVMAAVGALAACGAADGDDADASARAAPPAASAAPDTLAFVLHRVASGQVDSVFVTRAGRRLQALVPSRLQEGAVLDDPVWRVDLDFDGHVDFGLVTLVPAAPNPSYDYWRYDPAADRFRYVGEYEMFEPDSATRTLSTHARGGYAGRSWSNSRWRWQNDTLVEFWRNEQVPADSPDEHWIYQESEFRDGRWVVVRADTMEDCEAEPLRDECPREPAPAPASGVQGPPRT
jgi:hypothetical protein